MCIYKELYVVTTNIYLNVLILYVRLQEYYYVHRNSGAPLGKLYYKYTNWYSNLRNKSTGRSAELRAKRSKTDSFEYKESGSEQDHMRALKHDNLTFEEKLAHWKGCVATRLNSINKDTDTKKAITEMWPMYKEPSGYRLVNISYATF